MHVLLITTAYKSKFNPFNTLFFHDQANALHNNDCKVGVICPLPITFPNIWRTKRFIFSDEFYNDNGILTYVSPFISFPKLFKRTAKIRLEKGKLLFEKYVQENGSPDVIHVHTFLAGEIALWIKRKYNIPFIITEHSSNFERKLFSKSKLKLAEEVLNSSSKNIAVSQSLLQAIKDSIGDFKFEIIPNIVDTSFFKPLAKKDSNDIFQFITVGRLDENKNHQALIESFSKAFRNKKKYKLMIVGDGDIKDSLQLKINNLNMSSQITLFGSAKRNNVLRLLQESNCFVLSSKVETFGVVIIEAMSCGLPAISTNSGGPETIIIDDKLGVVTNLQNFENDLIKISSFSYDSSYIRNYVIDVFSSQKISEKLKSIYKEIIIKID